MRYFTAAIVLATLIWTRSTASGALTLRTGSDQTGGNVFSGTIDSPVAETRALTDDEVAALAAVKPGKSGAVVPSPTLAIDFQGDYTLAAWVQPDKNGGLAGRVFDHVTPGGADGFLFDFYAGQLRAISGSVSVVSPLSATAGIWVHIAVVCKAGAPVLFVNGKRATPGGASITHGPAALVASMPERVDAAMQKSIAWLYAQETHGNWELVQTRPPEASVADISGLQWTGLTALTTYALLSAGERETDSRLASAIDFLVQNPARGTYASTCRCLVWSRIKLTPARHAAAQKDVDFLISCMRSTGEAKGLFYYGVLGGPKDLRYDHSTSQMAVLGLSVMAAAGFEVPREFWQLTEQAWQGHQFPDGAWAYTQAYGRHVASMTAAGVATLLITQRISVDPSGCRGNSVDPHIDKGIAWLGANFDATFDRSRETANAPVEQYALFTISRVGVASGYRYFGNVDWYQRGADYLIATQQPDGSWPASIFAPTPLGLLFLAYGSSPVAVSKLEYTLPAETGKPAIARWNQRPQDLLNFVDWMGRQLETRLNWQVVNLSSTSQALHDAPILVISGSAALGFTDDEVAKLRHFVEEGGLIVGNADCDNEAFSKSFLELGRRMFSMYEFRELPPSHPIYTNEQYRAAKFRHPARVQGLSNGVRELMLLPSADISRAFQHRNETTAPDLYHLFDDIVLYAMDTSGLDRKGNSYLVLDDPAAPIAQTVKLARLQYDGNWDPEPGGWRRLAAVLHNNQKVALTVQAVKLGDGSLITPPAQSTVTKPTDKEIRQMAMKRIPPGELLAAMSDDPQKAEAMITAKMATVQAELDAAAAARTASVANFKLAYLTGTETLKLTDSQRQELKKFVQSGGTLIIDAAGGSTEFAASAEQMLRDVFGADAGQIEAPLPADSPIYHGAGHPIAAMHYRNFARRRLSNTTMPQLRGIKIGGRLAIIYSREDLSAGLVGEPVDGITGYTPASATELMTDIILGAAPAH